MAESRIKILLQVSALLLAAVLLFATMIMLRPEPRRQLHTVPVPLIEVIAATPQDLNMIVEGFGTVSPREELNLVSEVKGRAVWIHDAFKEGAFVNKNTALIQIDPSTYELEVDRLELEIHQKNAEVALLQQQEKNLRASIDIAASDVALEEADLKRLETLKTRNVIAQTTLDKARQQYLSSLQRLQELENQLALNGPQMDQIKAGLQVTTVMLKQARIDLERTRIWAPFDGWVLEKAVEQDQYIGAGQFVGRIYRDNALDIEVRIPVEEFEWIREEVKKGIMPEVEISPGNRRIDFIAKGRVSRVKAKMDEKTRTIPLVVEIDGTPKQGETGKSELHPGMFVTVRIKGKRFENVFELQRYLIHEGDVVYLVQGDQMMVRPVHVLRYFKESVYVDQGLAEGDLIVKTPLSGAVDGMKVRVR